MNQDTHNAIVALMGSEILEGIENEEGGEIRIDENGNASLEITLQEVNIMGMTGAAQSLQVYQGNDTTSDKQKAEILEKDKTTGNPTKVRFNIPEAVKTANGVYVSMKIDAMNGNSMDAYTRENSR